MDETNKEQNPDKSDFKAGIIFLVLVIVFAIIGAAFYLLGFGRSEIMAPAPVIVGSPLPAPIVENPISPAQLPSEEPISPVSETKPSEWVEATWLPAWKNIGIIKDDAGYDAQSYIIGKVTNGKFAGKDLYLAETQGMGLFYRHFVYEQNKPVFFDSQAPVVGIRGIDDMPEYITFKDTNYKLRKGYVGGEWSRQVKKSPAPLFTDPVVGDVYLSKDMECFMVKLPNGLAMGYDLVLPFADANTRVLQATWNSGEKNTSTYQFTIPVCMSLCYYLNIVSESDIKPAERLVVVGKTSNGEDLYGIKNSQDKVLNDLYGDKNTMAYLDESDGYKPLTKNKYTYEQFFDLKPLLYWKDPLGRWIEMKNEKFQVAAEMCKPVIYLYPTKPMDVSVKVFPNGGFTKTVPEYGNGWNVKASPNGNIFDYSTKQNYPYLFWEGIGMQYSVGEDGFVVAKSEVETFLDEKLSVLGLNQKESSDFKEYWVERMNRENSPAFHIRFLTNIEFNSIAPLSVIPRPQNTIRVMMTVRPVSKNISVPLQELPATPNREGFTVVEWGGAMLR